MEPASNDPSNELPQQALPIAQVVHTPKALPETHATAIDLDRESERIIAAMSDFIALTVSEKDAYERIDDLIKPPMVDVLKKFLMKDDFAKRVSKDPAIIGKVVSDDNVQVLKLFLDAPAFANRDEIIREIIRGNRLECLKMVLNDPKSYSIRIPLMRQLTEVLKHPERHDMLRMIFRSHLLKDITLLNYRAITVSLTYALKARSKDYFKIIIENLPSNTDVGKFTFGAVIEEDDVQFMQMILDCDSISFHSGEVLDYARKHNARNIFKILLDSEKVDINDLNDADKCPIVTTIAVFSDGGDNLWFLETLLNHPRFRRDYVRTNEHCPLYAAIGARSIEGVRTVLDFYATRKIILGTDETELSRVYHEAIEWGSMEVLETMLKSPATKILINNYRIVDNPYFRYLATGNSEDSAAIDLQFTTETEWVCAQIRGCKVAILAIDSNIACTKNVSDVCQEDDEYLKRIGYNGVLLLNTGIGEFENVFKTENPERYPNVSQDLLKENISSIQRGSILNATIKDCREVLQEIRNSNAVPRGATRLNEINDIAQMTILTRYTEKLRAAGVDAYPYFHSKDKGFISKCITLINT